MTSGNRPNAGTLNQAVIDRLEQRASDENGVLGPCLLAYKAQVRKLKNPADLIHNLTAPLLAAFEPTKKQIIKRFTAQWKGNTDQISKSVVNSLRRSAGTNYQALVSYALAKYLLAVGSRWYIVHPVPEGFRKALAITFTGGIDVNVLKSEAVAGEEDDVPTAYIIQPDVDILLRNSAWVDRKGYAEPLILLSVKTSLVDRAGMAARWKTYFDLATHPCAFQDKPECVYRRLGITMEYASRYQIQHGIVTANIYKINFHDERYKKGELCSGQTRSNTYMFDLKLTTRDDGIAETPADWKQFAYIAQVLTSLSKRDGLPS